MKSLERVGLNWTRILTAAIAVLLLHTEAASAETVVTRKRIGNNAEAMTYDPLNDRAVVMDGNDVIGVALNPLDAVVLATMRNDTGGIVGGGYRKLFDVLALPLPARQPKGILYLAAQHRYFFTSDEPGGTGTFYSTDEQGNPQPAIVLRGLATPVDFWEGLAWIPPGAPVHGGTIAALGYRNSEGVSHLYYVRLDGTVEEELIPQPGTALETYFCAVAYWPAHPSTLLLSDCGTEGIFEMDARTGAAVGNEPVIPTLDPVGFEGLIVRRNGRIVLSWYEGRLYTYDGAFHRTPADDRLFTVGIGASVLRISWNFDSNEFLVLSPSGTNVFSVSADLQQARRLFDVSVTNEVPNPIGIVYVGNNEVGLCNGGYPRGIDFVQLISDRYESPNGTSHLRSIWNPEDGFPPGQSFNTRSFSMLDPDTIVFRAIGDPGALKVVTRSGRPDASIYRDGVVPNRLPDIALSSPATGLMAQVFDDGSGKRIFTGAEIYGIDGTLIHRIDWQRLGLNKPPTDGVWIGGHTFAAVDGLTSTVVIYSVP
jgi:hypothetical protein